MTDTEKCAAYFKCRKSFDRIMNELHNTYRKYGELRGNIVISDASYEECDAANSIISPKKAFAPPVLKFKAADFERGFQKTAFGKIPLRDAVEEYFGKPILKRTDEKAKRAESEYDFLNGFSLIYAEKPCSVWLNAVRDKRKFGYSTVIGEFHSSAERAGKMMRNVCDAVNRRCCPEAGGTIPLAVLSADVTGDPHYFDKENTAGRLLIKALAFLGNMPETGSSEMIRAVYGRFGIEPDSISGASAAVGIRLYLADRTEHRGFKYFADSGEICLISAANLSRIEYADSDKKTVYAVENQMVFSELAAAACEHGLSLICTSGQMKYAGIRLIDMLVMSGCEIFYAGDFDPEGLQIADKLLCRYSSEKVHSWRMTPEDYASIAKGDIISESRLKKLDSIVSDELKETARLLADTKRAGYQELLIAQMSEDMAKFGEALTEKMPL